MEKLPEPSPDNFNKIYKEYLPKPPRPKLNRTTGQRNLKDSANQQINDVKDKNDSIQLLSMSAPPLGGRVKYLNPKSRDDFNIDRIVTDELTSAEKNECIHEYHQLISILQKIPGMKAHLDNFDSAKSSLAFLINELLKLKKTQAEVWESALDSLKNKIQEINAANPGNSFAEVTWLLHETIAQVYKIVLDEKLIGTSDSQKHKYYQMVSHVLDSCQQMNALIHSKGLRVSFGGVGQEFIPEWYEIARSTETRKSESPERTRPNAGA